MDAAKKKNRALGLDVFDARPIGRRIFALHKRPERRDPPLVSAWATKFAGEYRRTFRRVYSLSGVYWRRKVLGSETLFSRKDQGCRWQCWERPGGA